MGNGLEHAFFYPSQNHDRVYGTASFEHWLKKFFTSGVFVGELQVTANDDMTVTLGKGYVNIDGKVKIFDEEQSLRLETADATYDRIDSIVLERNDTERDVFSLAVTGGYSSNPTPLVPVRENGIYQMVVAQIRVTHGAVRITQADITDTRADPGLCGFVAGTVKEMDFSQFQAQFDSYFENYKNEIAERHERLEEYETEKKAQFELFQTGLIESETELHDQHEKALDDYFSAMQQSGNERLSAITQQLIDFRNTNEAEFLAWFEMIKGIFGTDPGGELLLKLNDLTEQVELNRTMIITGKVLTRIGTSQGGYITDHMGNPILIGWPICKCNT